MAKQMESDRMKNDGSQEKLGRRAPGCVWLRAEAGEPGKSCQARVKVGPDGDLSGPICMWP